MVAQFWIFCNNLPLKRSDYKGIILSRKMPDILQFCNRISDLNQEASDDFLKSAETRIFQKGEYLLKENEICKYYYFIESGLIKSFFYNDDKEFIMTFFRENTMLTEHSSYLTRKPSKYKLLALETSNVKCISQDNIEQLCAKHHCIETLFRKFSSIAAVHMMKRISEMLEANAATRYNNFLEENKGILQRISLGDMASYLGITQVSLSRIRAAK